MRFVPPHDQTLAAAFKAAAITFLTAWLIPGKRACKAGTSQGEARLRLVPNSRRELLERQPVAKIAWAELGHSLARRYGRSRPATVPAPLAGQRRHHRLAMLEPMSDEQLHAWRIGAGTSLASSPSPAVNATSKALRSRAGESCTAPPTVEPRRLGQQHRRNRSSLFTMVGELSAIVDPHRGHRLYPAGSAVRSCRCAASRRDRATSFPSPAPATASARRTSVGRPRFFPLPLGRGGSSEPRSGESGEGVERG